MRPTIRLRLLTATSSLALLAGLGACGSDDQAASTTAATTTAAPTSTAPTTTAVATTAAPTTTGATTTTKPPTTTSTVPVGSAAEEFCTGFTNLDQAFKDSPDDPAAMPAFVAEHVAPNMGLVRANLPAVVSSEVTVMLDTVATGNFDAFSDPDFAVAAEQVYSSMDDLCGLPVVEVTMADYRFDGVSDALPSGLTSFAVHNASAVEPHEMEIVKIVDGVELSAAELLAMPEEEVEQHIAQFGGGTFALPGFGGGTTVDLAPGRWLVACFIEVGANESGHLHWQEGMVHEFTVT